MKSIALKIWFLIFFTLFSSLFFSGCTCWVFQPLWLQVSDRAPDIDLVEFKKPLTLKGQKIGLLILVEDETKIQPKNTEWLDQDHFEPNMIPHPKSKYKMKKESTPTKGFLWGKTLYCITLGWIFPLPRSLYESGKQFYPPRDNGKKFTDKYDIFTYEYTIPAIEETMKGFLEERECVVISIEDFPGNMAGFLENNRDRFDYICIILCQITEKGPFLTDNPPIYHSKLTIVLNASIVSLKDYKSYILFKSMGTDSYDKIKVSESEHERTSSMEFWTATFIWEKSDQRNCIRDALEKACHKLRAGWL